MPLADPFKSEKWKRLTRGTKIPKGVERYLGAEDVGSMVGPVGMAAIAKKALFNIAAKGLPKKVQQTMAREFAAIPQRSLDLINSAKVTEAVPGRAGLNLARKYLGYHPDVARRSHPGLTSHEVGHMILEKFKSPTKLGIIKEYRGMSPTHKKLLERTTKTKLDKPHELGAEAYRQATLKNMGERNVLNLFPPYTQRLSRRLKKWGQ